MQPNFVSGNWVASLVTSSLKMNPTPMTTLSPAAARWRSALSRSEPSPGSIYCVWTPSSALALNIPRLAASLNDLSPSPPTSKTRPTLVLLPDLAAPVPDPPAGAVVGGVAGVSFGVLSAFSLGWRLQPEALASSALAKTAARTKNDGLKNPGPIMLARHLRLARSNQQVR